MGVPRNTLGGTEFEYSWMLSDSEGITPNQSLALTMGGVRTVYNLGHETRRYEFTAVVPNSNANKTDYDDVLTLLESTMQYGANSVTWISADGQERTVYNIGSIGFENMGEYRKLKLTLEVEAGETDIIYTYLRISPTKVLRISPTGNLIVQESA